MLLSWSLIVEVINDILTYHATRNTRADGLLAQ